MHETEHIDELDLALLNALQIAPRAPWAQLAGPLGVDPATLSRRWSRLTESGLAWVTCHRNPYRVAYGAVAFMEVDCPPARRPELAATFAAHPHAASVEMTVGSCDLVVTIATETLDRMAAYVNALADLPGITASRVHLAQRTYSEGSRWRLDSLNREQEDALKSSRTGDLPSQINPNERRLMLLLAQDGRRSYTQLAADLDCSEPTVRRMMTGLLNGKAVLRCEAAHLSTGWQGNSSLWITVPPADLDTAAAEIARQRETRLTAAITSDANLLTVAWLHNIRDLSTYEASFAARYPDARVVRRATTLTWVKRMGRLLDAHGRSVGHVPMDVWAPIPSMSE